MHYIRQLVDGGVEEWVHPLFTRYGRGEFNGPVCEADVGKQIKFKASAEYCSVLGSLVASSGVDFKVDGAMYAKVDFRDILHGIGVDFDDKSKAKQGYFVANLKGEYPSGVLAEIYEKAPYATILFNLTCGKNKFKCKKKPPKPRGEKNVDFCSGSMDASAYSKLKEEVFFDCPDFKKAKVENTIIIDELLIPPGLDPTQARLQAKRKGKLVRKLTADGVGKKTESEILV